MINSLLKPLAVNYLDIDKTVEADLLIETKYDRLKRVCGNIQNCQLKVVSVAQPSVEAVDRYLPNGVELYTLRSPASTQDSIETALANAFAKMYRQLIELQIKEKY